VEADPSNERARSYLERVTAGAGSAADPDEEEGD